LKSDKLFVDRGTYGRTYGRTYWAKAGFSHLLQHPAWKCRGPTLVWFRRFI